MEYSYRENLELLFLSYKAGMNAARNDKQVEGKKEDEIWPQFKIIHDIYIYKFLFILSCKKSSSRHFVLKWLLVKIMNGRLISSPAGVWGESDPHIWWQQQPLPENYSYFNAFICSFS